MKHFVALFIICLVVIAAGCEENAAGNGPLEPDLYGSWDLKLRSGGIAGRIIYPDGINSYSVKILLENTYVESRNDTVVFTAAFVVRYDSTYQRNIIDFTDSRWFSLVIEHVTQDSLIVSDGFIDGYASVYLRKKQ